MDELKKMRNELILRYVMLALGAVAQIAGFAFLWQHDWKVAVAVGLVIMGHGWTNRAGGK